MTRPSAHLERLGLALVAAVVAVVGLSSVRSWDIWWHLKTGELALSRLSTLPVDEFSLTRAGEPWLYKDLGADVLFYAAYSALGPAGLAILKLAVALAVFVLLLRLIGRSVRQFWLGLLVVGIAFVAVSFRIIVRPEAFTLVLLLASLLVIDRWRAPAAGSADAHGERIGFGRTLVALVAIFVLWANLHRGVVLGLLLLWVQAIYELLAFTEARVTRRAPRLFRAAGGLAAGSVGRALSAIAFAVAATFASLLNPYGARPLLMAFDVTSSETVAQLVSEWQALSFTEHVQQFPVATAWLVVAALSVTVASVFALRRGGRPTAWDLCVTALFIGIGLSAVRMLPLMVIGTCGPMASALSRLPTSPTPAATRHAPALAAIVGLVVCLVAWTDPRIEPSRPGLAANWYPEAATNLLVSVPIRGEGFTTFTYAGYVIFHAWPDKHVICDGRFDTVYDDETMALCLRADRDPAVWAHLQQTLDLEWVLTHNRPASPSRETGTGAFGFLNADPAWRLVYWDSVALIYVRAQGPNAAIAQQMAYTFLRPHDPDVSLFEALHRTAGDPQGRARLDAEVRRLQSAAPTDYRTHIVLALYLHEIGASDSGELDVVVDALRANRHLNPNAIDQVLEWIGRPGG